MMTALLTEALQKVEELAPKDQAAIAERILRAVSTPVPPSVRVMERQVEMSWLAAHRHEYLGQWLAIEGDRLVGVGTFADTAMEQARASGFEQPLLAYAGSVDKLPSAGW